MWPGWPKASQAGLRPARSTDQSKQSYQKYNLPTVSTAKVKGAAFVPNGISDEEMVIKGYGVIDSSQATKLLDRLKNDIHNLINRNVTGAVLKSKIDLYTSIIEQITWLLKFIYYN